MTTSDKNWWNFIKSARNCKINSSTEITWNQNHITRMLGISRWHWHDSITSHREGSLHNPPHLDNLHLRRSHRTSHPCHNPLPHLHLRQGRGHHHDHLRHWLCCVWAGLTSSKGRDTVRTSCLLWTVVVVVVVLEIGSINVTVDVTQRSTSGNVYVWNNVDVILLLLVPALRFSYELTTRIRFLFCYVILWIST